MTNAGTPTLVHELLETSARLHPDKTAIVHDGVRATYRQINSMANRLSAWLLGGSVSSGERVVILLENGIQYIVSYYGILKAGAVAVPLNCDIKSETLRTFLQQLQPKVIISSGKHERLVQSVGPGELGIEKLLVKGPSLLWHGCNCSVTSWDDIVDDEIAANPSLTICGSDLASIIYTSGSTGTPKGVMLSHTNIVSNTFSIVTYLGLTAADIQMIVLPFFYVMGKSLLNTHFAVGGTVVINNRFAYPACVVEEMIAEGVTGFSGVPSTYACLLHRSPLATSRDRLGSLRYCTQAGGHMSRQVKEKLLQVLPPHTKLYIMYGATEAAARLTYVEPERLQSKIESIGRPIPGVRMKVMDEKGNVVPRGTAGELVADGPNIMMGYWRDSESTAAVLDDDGYHTGDLGYEDEDGYLYVTGRKDSLLKVGGYRINPQEVEDAMMATDLLMEVAVIGVNDDILGQRIVAIAAPVHRMLDEREILARCFTKLPRYKMPTEIKLVDSVPKNSNGKIDRGYCVELFNKN